MSPNAEANTKANDKAVVLSEKPNVNSPDKAGSSQKTRFEPSRLSHAWSALKHRLTPPSHPSTTSESGIDSSFNNTDLFYSESEHQHGSTGTSAAVDLLNPRAATSSKHKRKGVPERLIRSRTRQKSSVANSTSRYGDDEEPGAGSNAEPVSHVVVDNDFEHYIPVVAKSDSGSKASGGPTGVLESSGAGFMSRTEEDEDGNPTKTRSDAGSIRTNMRGNWLKRSWPYELVVDRAWPNFRHFLDSSFPEPAKERSFQKEAWFTQKQGALASAAFYLISWILTAALLPTPLSVWNWYAYVGLAAFFTVPIPIFVIMDVPRRRNWLWQPWLLCATWYFADILVIEMYSCGYFSSNNTCGDRNFLNLMGFAFGQPVLAILAMRQNRLFATIGPVQWIILIATTLMTQDDYPKLFYRTVVNFGLFHAFLIGTSFLKEKSDRQMFALRQQLKIQYRATQSAQVMERRAADSKKRFVSYIFHEVRVPLNTALLAVQNLDGEDVFKGLHEDQSEMVHGLMGSLTMMEKVLNDVLSFNRMESGKFTQARKPFEFHKSIQLVALSHRMQAQMAGIELIVDLDKDIDRIGGMFVGDEMRLRQVTSNLVSNSIKFTDRGSVRIVTKLLYPRMGPSPENEIDDPLDQAARNSAAQERPQSQPQAFEMQRYGSGPDVEKGSLHIEARRHSRDEAREQQEKEERNRHKAVVRVEIHDTGVGLKKQDVIDNRLFSPYVQTEIGRRQGGKGSGLGLALVRQIVKLSNGRLGVESEFGKGSMFWFELPYSLPGKGRASSGPRLSGKDLPTGPLGSTTASIAPMPLTSMSSGVSFSRPGSRPTSSGVAESSTSKERPVMHLTESTMALLPDARTRRGAPTPETTILTTYPIPPGSTPRGSVTDDQLPLETPYSPMSDPFSVPAVAERRSSEFSDMTRVNLPSAATSPVAARVRPLPTVPPSPEPPLCTLVVDDDKLTRMLMSRMLSRLGHQVTTAENGKVALEMIKDSFGRKPNAPRFDVVFLDNQMPLMSGVEVAREVREMGCPLYIVGCTGNALREDQEEYLAAGADGIIPKPIHQKAVQDMIREARRRVAGETSPKDLEPEEEPVRSPGGHHRF